MKKNDLETGMLLECDDCVYLLIDGQLVERDDWDELGSYNEDLTCGVKSYIINRISKVVSGSDLKPSNWTTETVTRNLLWERSPIQTVEIAGQKFNKEEVENALKDLKPIK